MSPSIRLVICSALFLVVACSAKPATTTDGEDQPNDAPDHQEVPKSPGHANPPPDTPGGNPPPAPPPPPTDAGTPSGGGVFAGAPAYKGTPPTTRASSRHLISVTGANCMQCHGLIAKSFAFAGTANAPGAEIRVVDEAGKEIGLATSDADGNFWSLGDAPTGTMKTGIRTSKGTVQMAGTITATGCNASGCHDANRKLTAP